MVIRSLKRQEVDLKPFLVWNAFVDLLAMERYEDLTQIQRPAFLVFWYESEVQNGGHLQYFENLGGDRMSETLEALTILGTTCQHQVLREAGAVWVSGLRKKLQTSEEYCERALEGEFDDFDSRFHACSPTLQQGLESYLKRHQSAFVIVT